MEKNKVSKKGVVTLKRVIATVSLAALLVSGCGSTDDKANINQPKNQPKNEVNPSPLASNYKPTKNNKTSNELWLKEMEKQENLLNGSYKDKPKPPVGDWIPVNGRPPERLRTWSNKYMLPIPGWGTCIFGEGGNPEYEPKYQVYLDWFFDRDVNWDALNEPQRDNYTLEEVAQMSKEERYKEVAKLLTEAKDFYLNNFYRVKPELMKERPESWFRQKQQVFLRDYYHTFHVLCAKEFSESKVNTEMTIGESEKHVWFFDDVLRGWANEMEKDGIEYHMLYGFTNYQDAVDTSFRGN